MEDDRGNRSIVYGGMYREYGFRCSDPPPLIQSFPPSLFPRYGVRAGVGKDIARAKFAHKRPCSSKEYVRSI